MSIRVMVFLLGLLTSLAVPHTGSVRGGELKQEPPPLRTAAEWVALAATALEAEHTKEYLPRSESGNSWQYYNLAYAIDGNTTLFEAAGDLKYLDRALSYAENAVKSAKPSRQLPASQYKDDFLAWPASDHPIDKTIQGGEYPLYESYCWRYVARALRVVRQTPAVWADREYRARFDRLLAFTENHVFRKWVKRGDKHLYRSHTHMASHWAYIALELSVLTADPKLRDECRKVYTSINTGLPSYKSSLRQQFRPHPKNPAAYFWAAEWGSEKPPGQDVAHGNNVVAYFVEAHDLGVEWTEKDVGALCILVKEILWVSESDKWRYAEFVDGTGVGNGWFNDGFMKLGRYDEAIQRRLEDHRVGRGVQFFGNAALNAKRLAERKK